MTVEEIYERLRERFGAEVIGEMIATDTSDRRNVVVFDPPQIRVQADRIAEVGAFCREDDALRFDSLMNLASVHVEPRLAVVYVLHSMTHHHKVALRVEVPRRDPRIPTVAHVWRTAEWHEREAADMMGFVFEGHPDPRPILLPEGWEGHPLLKDYETPLFYKGMRVPY